MSDLTQRAAWERLADYLGYTLISVGPDDVAAPTVAVAGTLVGATMRRPDGSLAQFGLEARDLLRLVEAMSSPASAAPAAPASPDEPQR